jgi:hypothetical protein
MADSIHTGNHHSSGQFNCHTRRTATFYATEIWRKKTEGEQKKPKCTCHFVLATKWQLGCTTASFLQELFLVDGILREMLLNCRPTLMLARSCAPFHSIEQIIHFDTIILRNLFVVLTNQAMTRMGQKRKYVLFKKEGDDAGPKLCAFFASEAGCRTGSACMFVHCKNGETFPTNAVAAAAPAATTAATTDVPTDVPTAKPAPVALTATVNAVKAKPAPPVRVEAPVATVRPAAVAVAVVAPTSCKKVKVTSAQNTPASEKRRNREKDDEDSSSLLFGAVNVALNGYTPVEKSLTRKEKSLKKNSSAGKKGAFEVLDKEHTAKVLSTSGTTHATRGAKSLSKNLSNRFDSVADQKPVSLPAKKESMTPEAAVRPLAPSISAQKEKKTVAGKNQPSVGGNNLLQEALSLISACNSQPAARPRTLQDILHPGAIEWLSLIEATRASPKHDKDYTFPVDDPTWCGSQLGHGYVLYIYDRIMR